jgi:acetyl esterase/lipase
MSAIAQGTPIPIWPGGAPGSEDWTQAEQLWENPMDGAKVVRNVSRPTLTPYLPDPATATGMGVVVAPGGGFHFLAYEHEGSQVAEWLVERGVAAFVLHYRVQPTPADESEYERYHQEVFGRAGGRGKLWEITTKARALGVEDGRQALRLVRQRAQEWGVKPGLLGIMGFSAGGYVTLGASFEHDAESRPDFAAPIYSAPWPNADVPADAPSLFLTCAANDQMAVGASLPLFSAWRDAGHSVELHVFAQGGHGFGMRKQGLPSDHWIELFGNWLLGQRLIAERK